MSLVPFLPQALFFLVHSENIVQSSVDKSNPACTGKPLTERGLFIYHLEMSFKRAYFHHSGWWNHESHSGTKTKAEKQTQTKKCVPCLFPQQRKFFLRPDLLPPNKTNGRCAPHCKIHHCAFGSFHYKKLFKTKEGLGSQS